MRTLPALAALGILVSTTGCTATFTRLSGTEGPFELRPDDVTYRELGRTGSTRLLARNGPGGLLVLQGGKARKVSNGDSAFSPRLAQIMGDKVVYRRGNGLFERRVGDAARHERKVLELPGLRRYLVTPDRVFVADDHTLYQAAYPKPDAEPQPFLSSRVEALAWDPIRRLIWVTQSEPFAVIEALDPGTRDSRYLVPLPLELEGGDLEILFSGGNVAIYAHDRPLQAGLLVQPRSGHVWQLCGGSERPPSAHGEGPRVLSPPGRLIQGRISRALSGEPTFGRLAPWGSDRFLVLDDQETGFGPSIGVLAASTESDTPPTLRNLEVPEDWPRAIQGLGWDEEGVTLVANNQILRVTSKDFRDRKIHAHPGLLARRFLNILFWVPLTALETAGAFAVNSLVASVAVPLSPIALAVGQPEVFGVMITSPIWLPFGGTFGLPTLATTERD
ncbi:MAG: hypothetical protein JKY65_32885 [Planctomycetes bacterium]|nr:hypothetical protein [Planctomycetota bacterium]